MLKRLYVNNYRCLVNFELNFGRITLLMGPNGVGKSSIFDLLFGIRRLLVDNARIGEVISQRDITAWIKSNEQSIELDVQGEEGQFTYKLAVSYNPEIRKQGIDLEQLLYNNNPLFECKRGEVQLYHDDHTRGPAYTYDWTMSALSTIIPRSDNKKLTWFKSWIEKLFIVSLRPHAISSETEEESNWLNRDGSNFASWYRYISQEYQDKIFQLTERLRETIPGFHAFKLEQAGKHRILKVGFSNEEDKSGLFYLDFEQLSDGQRIIIILYSLLLGLQDLGQTVFLDEPENYVALPEIQPWLMELNDACGEGFPQAVLISHHPELIDYFGPECGKWIERENLGPVRVKNLPEKIEDGLKLSELIARGWTE
ncbi:MAG: AAA family ATPase [Pseudomonadota bacterium]